MTLTFERRRKYVSNQMITFSFRTTPEAVQTLKQYAQKKKTSCGALLREMIEQIPTKEKSHENENRENDRPGNDVDSGGGL
jgi:hypothetical protein